VTRQDAAAPNAGGNAATATAAAVDECFGADYETVVVGTDCPPEAQPVSA